MDEGENRMNKTTGNEEVDEKVWSMRCQNCLRCNAVEDCKKCVSCQQKKVCEMRRCLQAKRMYAEKLEMERKAEEKARQKAALMAKHQQSSTTSATEATSAAAIADEVEKKKRGRKKGQTKSKSEKEASGEMVSVVRPTRGAMADMKRKRAAVEILEPRQCLNPDCILEAQQESKYCSEECGKILARMRLVEVLPARMKTYFNGPISRDEEMEQKRLQLTNDMQELTVSEKKLDETIRKLFAFLEKFKNAVPDEDEKIEDDFSANSLNSQQEPCVVCGSDIPVRRYEKHIELCWSRSEKTISFGANEIYNSSIYCEKFDGKTKTYCKRLKSLCPEHRKPGPEQFLKVCCYPTKWEEAKSITMSELIESEDPFGSSGCLTKKDACLKHWRWIQTFRGSIELEQAGLLQRMYEFCLEKTKCQNYTTWSTNMLNVLLYKPATTYVSSDSSTTDDPTTSEKV